MRFNERKGDLSLVDETTLESLRQICLSLLTPNSEVHQLSWRLGTDDEFCRLCPLTAIVDLQMGAAPYISNAKTPAQTLAVFEQLDIALQEATIVPSAYVVSASRVVVGDNTESLQEGLPVCLRPSSPFDHQHETVKFVLDILCLEQSSEIAGAALYVRLTGPAADQEAKFLHCVTLLHEIRLMERLLHMP